MAPSKPRKAATVPIILTSKTPAEAKAKVAKRPSRKKTFSPESNSSSPLPKDIPKRRVRNAAPKPRECPSVTAKAATPTYKFVQRMTCQSLKKNGSDAEHCKWLLQYPMQLVIS